MYINIKSKYKKFFWILLGFMLSCFITDKVFAATSYSSIQDSNYNFDNFSLTYNGYTYNKTTIYTKIIDYLTNNTSYTLSDFKYIFIGVPSQRTPNIGYVNGFIYIDLFGSDYNPSSFTTGGTAFGVWHSDTGSSLNIHLRIGFGDNSISRYNINPNSSTTLTAIYSGTQKSYIRTYTNYSIDLSMINNTSDYSDYVHFYIGDMGYNFTNNDLITVNFHLNGGTAFDNSNPLSPVLHDKDYSLEIKGTDLNSYLDSLTLMKSYSTFLGWYYDANFTQPYNSSDTISSDINLYAKFDLYDYLQGYTEIKLEPGERYVIFSSSTISSGSVYIPISDFNNYGSRISYFDKDIATQPYTSYIQDFSTTSDGLFAKQDFDLSSYSGSDFIMFSKYIYLEGPDDFSSSVWVPSSMYSSIVEVSPNNSGGNDFDFSYVDANGELQAEVISSSDLTEGSPLISDLFTNFTTNDYGLSSIITAPLPLLQSLGTSTCTPIELPLDGFTGRHDQTLTLPCMTPLYQSWLGNFFTLYQTITTGFIAYWVGLAFFNQIKQLKDPDNDKIEVVDL